MYQSPSAAPSEASNQRESALAINSTNPPNWLAVFMDDYLDPNRNPLGYLCAGWPCRNRVRVVRTMNFGVTWSAPVTFAPTIPFATDETTQSFDPAVAFDGTGMACVVYVERFTNTNETALIARTSTDGGATWNPPATGPGTLIAGPYRSTAWTIDKPWLAASDPGAVCEICDVPCTIHLSWSELQGSNSRIMYANTQDAGLTWSASLEVSNVRGNYVAPTIAVSGTKVYVSWLKRLDQSLVQLMVDPSNDCGNTFSADRPGFIFREIDINGVGPYASNCSRGYEHQFSIPSVAAIGNSLFVVWAEHAVLPAPNCRRARVRYNSSPDQGTTWTWTWGGPPAPSPYLDVSNAPSDRETFCPSIVNPSGTNNLFVTFYDKRNDTEGPYYNKRFDLYGTATNCAAAGCAIQWAPAVRLSTVISDPFWGLPLGDSFFGHFNGLALLASHLAVGTWTDCRNGNPPGGHTPTWQDIWWNYFFLCSDDAGASSSSGTLSAGAGGTLALDFEVPPQWIGTSYEICAGWSTVPSRRVRRRLIPVADDDLSAAVKEQRGMVTRGFSGLVPEDGHVSARIDFSPMIHQGREVNFALVAGSNGEFLSAPIIIQVVP